MRIWSLHPKHFDTKGLVALWREATLRGYNFNKDKIDWGFNPTKLNSIEYLTIVKWRLKSDLESMNDT